MKRYLMLVLAVLFIVVSCANAQYQDLDKYVDTNPRIELQNSGQLSYGMLSGRLRTSNNILTKTIGIRNDAAPEYGFKYFPIRPDGTFDEILIPGTFTICVPNGNGDQTEYSKVTIVAGQTSHPVSELIGNAPSYDQKQDVRDFSLHIRSAMYRSEATGNVKDVTDIVSGLIVGNAISYPGGAGSYNALFGVPSGLPFGGSRTLTITYTLNGATTIVTYNRDAPISIGAV